MWVAAWEHLPLGVAAGLALIVLGWTYGFLPPWRGHGSPYKHFN